MAMDNVRNISTGTTSSINPIANNVSKSGSSGDSLSKFKQSFEENSDKKNKKDTTNSVQNMPTAYRRIKKRAVPKDDIINQLMYQQNLIKNKIPSNKIIRPTIQMIIILNINHITYLQKKNNNAIWQ